VWLPQLKPRLKEHELPKNTGDRVHFAAAEP